jgi:hypothetical protein
LSTTPKTLDGRDIASLVGRGFRFLLALEINMKLHHGIKLLKLLVINHDSALDGNKEQVSDLIFKVVNLRALLKGGHVELSKSGMSIVLLQVSSAVLIKIKVLAVARIMQ